MMSLSYELEAKLYPKAFSLFLKGVQEGKYIFENWNIYRDGYLAAVVQMRRKLEFSIL